MAVALLTPRDEGPHRQIRSWHRFGPQGWMLLHAGLGQVLAFGLSMILSRLYGPEEFGIYIVFANIFAMANMVLTLRYEQGILYEKSANETGRLVALSCAVAVPLTLAMYTGLVLSDALNGFGAGQRTVALLLCLSALLASMQRVVTLLMTRWKLMRDIASLNLVKPGIVGAMQCLTGLLSSGSVSLAVGHTLAYVALFSASILRCKHLTKVRLAHRMSMLRATALRHKRFPQYNMTQNALHIAGEAAIPLAIVTVFGAAPGGLYWFASRVTSVPMQVFVESLRPMIYRDIALRLGRGEAVARRVRIRSVLLVLPFLLGTASLAFLGADLFGLLFGSDWKSAADIAILLLGAFSMHAMSVPYIASLPVLGMQQLYLMFECIGLAARLGCFAFCSRYGLLPALTASLATGALVQLAFLVRIDYAIRTLQPGRQNILKTSKGN